MVATYAKHGWPVFPCRPREKRPLTEHGFKEATTDQTVIRKWWEQWPDANIGVPTGGASGLLVIDLDKKAGIDGEATLAALVAKHGALSETARQRTGSGGSQLFYLYPSGVTIGNSTGKLGPGIDVRGEGGYVVVPPSIHPSGPAYKWEHRPSKGIAKLPAWLLELLRKSDRDKQPVASKGATFSAGQRNDGLFRLASTLRAKSLGPDAIRAALLEENLVRCTPPLTEAEVDRIAESAGRYPAGEDSASTAFTAYHPPWPILHEAALYGLAGEVVRLIEPHTEADPCALLFQFHAAIGSVIGRAPYFQVEGDRHHVNLNTILVGDTAKGRKGTSWGQVRRLLKAVDETWAAKRCASGLSSGEGLKYHVRDARTERKPIKGKGGRVTDYQEVEVDAGVRDKRLLVTEGEFARALRVIERDGNTLSDVIRMAWDTGDLRDLVKHDPIVATGAHISIIGHITRQELLRYLTSTEAGNGFANRFLWVCVRRSKELPEGGTLHSVDQGPLLRQLAKVVGFARSVAEVKRDTDAREIWRAAYHELSASQPGLLGTVTARGEAQVVRLSLLYALLDLSDVIRKEHLLAALALWKYAEDSAAHIFGAATGDRVADRIDAALRESPEGLTREELRQLFNRNEKSERIGQALDLLREAGRVMCIQEKNTGGRPAERWVHSENAKATR